MSPFVCVLWKHMKNLVIYCLDPGKDMSFCSPKWPFVYIADVIAGAHLIVCPNVYNICISYEAAQHIFGWEPVCKVPSGESICDIQLVTLNCSWLEPIILFI